MGRAPEEKRDCVIKSDGKSNYSLYRNSSKRVPGKKHPQPVQTYIGAITPQGVMERFAADRKSSGTKVWEYGFSYALQSLAPPTFMKGLTAPASLPRGKSWKGSWGFRLSILRR